MRAFDGYRALAVVAVVLFHVFQVNGVTGAAGDSLAGVLIWGALPGGLYAFFIVSGFVMFLPTVSRDGDFGRLSAFAIRRAARLMPAYLLALVAALILIAIVAPPRGFPGVGLILSHVAMLQGPALLVAGDYRLGFDVVPPVWTLSVEAVFYIALPFVALSYFRHPLIGLAVAAGIVVGWHELAANADAIAGAFGGNLSEAAESRIQLYYASQFPTWAFAIASGMTAAWAYIWLRDRVPSDVLERWALRIAAPVGLLLVALMVLFAGREAVQDEAPLHGLFGRQSVWITLGYPAALAVTFIALALVPTRVQSPFTNAPIRWLADVSYGVYLIHFAVIWFALHKLSLPQDGTAWATLTWSALVFSISIGYAYLSARFLERPIRRRAHRFGRHGQELARREARAGTAPTSTEPDGQAARPARPQGS